jgi:hypothetical protein
MIPNTEQVKALVAFARKIIRDECWDCCDIDGGTIQAIALKLGLIEPKIATVEDVGDHEFCDFEVGDTIYVFSEILKEKE